MKRVFTLFTILAFTAFLTSVKGQLVAHYTTNYISGDASASVQANIEIINTSLSSVVTKVVMSDSSLTSGHSSYFCWGGTCYPPTTFTSPAFTLAPGDSSILITYASPNGTTGTDVINFLVYDTTHAASNKVSVNMTYDFATGINVLNRPSTNYLICSQSTMDDMTNVSYSISNFKGGKIVIRNLLGSVVKEIPLADKQGVLTISTSEMPAGLYMYFLYNNSIPIATKKMVVTH